MPVSARAATSVIVRRLAGYSPRVAAISTPCLAVLNATLASTLSPLHRLSSTSRLYLSLPAHLPHCTCTPHLLPPAHLPATCHRCLHLHHTAVAGSAACWILLRTRILPPATLRLPAVLRFTWFCGYCLPALTCRSAGSLRLLGACLDACAPGCLPLPRSHRLFYTCRTLPACLDATFWIFVMRFCHAALHACRTFALLCHACHHYHLLLLPFRCSYRFCRFCRFVLHCLPLSVPDFTCRFTLLHRHLTTGMPPPARYIHAILFHTTGMDAPPACTLHRSSRPLPAVLPHAFLRCATCLRYRFSYVVQSFVSAIFWVCLLLFCAHCHLLRSHVAVTAHVHYWFTAVSRLRILPRTAPLVRLPALHCRLRAALHLLT